MERQLAQEVWLNMHYKANKEVNKKILKLSISLKGLGHAGESAAVAGFLRSQSEKTDSGGNISDLLEETTIEKKDNSNIDKPTDQSLSSNFSLYEFSCKDKDKTPVPKEYLENVKELAKNLQIIRDEVGKPIEIISGYRTPEYNKNVGGASKSQHMLAKAADIKVSGVTSEEIKTVIFKLIDDGKISQGGVGSYPGFVHYDVRGVKARW